MSVAIHWLGAILLFGGITYMITNSVLKTVKIAALETVASKFRGHGARGDQHAFAAAEEIIRLSKGNLL